MNKRDQIKIEDQAAAAALKAGAAPREAAIKGMAAGLMAQMLGERR